MSAFNVDFKTVQWGPTLLLHLLRSFSAGLVWAVVLLAMHGTSSNGLSWWAMPLILPCAYFVAFPMYYLIAKIVAAFAGEWVVGILTLIFALGIVVGDPLVCILHKAKPAFVPTENFKLFNIAVIVFVVDPSKVEIAEAFEQ